MFKKGKFLRELIARNNLTQGKLADALGVSSSILSNYITGKNIPEMDTLKKCVNRFEVKGKDLKNLFAKAFFDSAKNHQTIVLDTRYFRGGRLNTLVQVLVALLLVSDRPSDPNNKLPKLSNLADNIKGNYDAMDTDDFLELVKPSQDKKNEDNLSVS